MSAWQQLLQHLMRSGTVGFYCYETVEQKTLDTGRVVPCERESVWWDCDRPTELPELTGPHGYRHHWFGVHPCRMIPPTSKKTGKPIRPRWVRSRHEFICAVNCLFAEFDAKDFGGDKETAWRHICALQAGPSVVIDSGGGFHCYWLLKETWHIGDDNREEAKRLQHAWVTAVGGDEGAKNLNRVLRIPGSINYKPSYAPDYPRVEFRYHDLAKQYPLEQLRALVPAEALQVAEYVPSQVDDNDRERAPALLRMLDPWRCDDREQWLRVGMALTGLGTYGLGLWDDWSRGSSKYTPHGCERAWKGLDTAGIQFATLAHMAKEDNPQAFASLNRRNRPEHNPQGVGLLQPNVVGGDEPPDTPPPMEPDDWRRSLSWTEPNRYGKQKPKNMPVNALKILTHDERWRDVLGYDEFRNACVFLKRPQFSQEYAIDFEEGQPLTELDIDRISYWLQETWDLNLAPERIARIVEAVASQRSYHPVRSYLNSLEWDGVERIGEWLLTYCNAKPANNDQAEYMRLVGKWWLMSAVARIEVPGAKADYVLVLEGEEGIRKSSALRILAGDWFTDAALDLNNKDSYLQIQGSWIVEIAELDALMRSESSTAKAFFTRSTDKFRPPYGRQTVEWQRQCVCAGTVNHNDYIKDYTGGRRYWPVWCTKIDLEALARDRDQLWAEALHCYREGERYWPEGKRQRDLCRVEQQARQIDDPWEYSIVFWIAGRVSVTSSQILEHAIEMPRDKWNRGHQTRIGQIMTRLGWRRKRARDDEGNFITQYVPPVEDES